jgi:hypothetical protein
VASDAELAAGVAAEVDLMDERQWDSINVSKRNEKADHKSLTLVVLSAEAEAPADVEAPAETARAGDADVEGPAGLAVGADGLDKGSESASMHCQQARRAG